VVGAARGGFFEVYFVSRATRDGRYHCVSCSRTYSRGVRRYRGEPTAPGSALYTVALKSDALGHSWTGAEKISFSNPGTVPITEFWIRLWGNGGSGCGGTPPERIGDLTGGHIAETRENCTAYRIVLDTALVPDARAEVGFSLAIDVPVRRDRFGVNGVDTYLGNALAVLAVKDEDGWELAPYVPFGESYYSETADYDVTLDHPAALQVPSTGVVAGETAVGDRLVTHLSAVKVRDFSWSAGAFHHDSVVAASGVTVEAYWPNSESDSNCRDLMRYAANALDSYGARYGAYPYPRFTIVFDEFGAAFDGMEYPNYTLASAYRGAVAHEVAHQWWFGLVGDDQYRRLMPVIDAADVGPQAVGGSEYRSIAAGVVDAFRKVSSHGPVLTSMSLPKPIHLPESRRPVGSARSCTAP
jgi:hypothetical protein